MFPAVTVPFPRPKCWFKLRQLVGLEYPGEAVRHGPPHVAAFACGTLTGVISALKRPASMALAVFLLGAQGKSVLLLTTDYELIRQIFGSNTHVIVVERIPQAVMDHAVFHTGMTQPQPARAPSRK